MNGSPAHGHFRLEASDGQRANLDRTSPLSEGEPVAVRGDEAFDRLTRLAAQVSGADVAVVSLVAPARRTLLNAHMLAGPGEGVPETPMSHIFSQHVVVNDAALIVPDTRKHQLPGHNPALEEHGVLAYAGYPLHDPDGVVVGALSVSASTPQVWTVERLEMLRDLTVTIETEIAGRLRTNHAHLHERLQHVIDGFVHTAVLAADADGIVTVMNRGAEKFLGLAAASVLGTRTLASVLHACHPLGSEPGEEHAQDWFMVDSAGSTRVVSVWSSVLRDSTGQVAGYTFVGDDVSTRREADALLRETVRKQDQVVERLTELDRARHIFVANASHELRTPISSILGYTELLLDGAAGHLSPAQLQLLKRVDGNSKRLSALVEDLLDLSRSETATRGRVRAGMDANSMAEHAWGAIQSDLADRSLHGDLELSDVPLFITDGAPVERALIELLRNAVKFSVDGGIVRLIVRASSNGVEYEVTDTGIGIPDAARGFVFDPFFRTEQAQSLAIPGAGVGLSIVRRIVEAHQGQVLLTSRMGIGTTVVVALPATAQDVLPGAGGNDVPLAESPEPTTRDTSLEADLRRALEGTVTEFVLHYQPVVDLSSGWVVGVESLVRWQHPTLGLLHPDRFIALAEDANLVHQLGDWVLTQAVQDAPFLTHEGRDLDVAVNFSARQLDGRAVGKIQRALEGSGLRPGRLTLEVTESAFVENDEMTAVVYEAMSRLGVKIAIDDFGTGSSSLLHLRRYPIDALKIDGEFVAGIGERVDDEAICESIITLAGAVGASSVAEGVETPAQYAVLRSLGCLRGQGFLWSPAVPIDDLGSALAACDTVPVAPRRSRMSQAPAGLPDEVTAIIARMHTEGASAHTIAAALNRTVGRHPTGVRWTAGAVARVKKADRISARNAH